MPTRTALMDHIKWHLPRIGPRETITTTPSERSRPLLHRVNIMISLRRQAHGNLIIIQLALGPQTAYHYRQKHLYYKQLKWTKMPQRVRKTQFCKRATKKMNMHLKKVQGVVLRRCVIISSCSFWYWPGSIPAIWTGACSILYAVEESSSFATKVGAFVHLYKSIMCVVNIHNEEEVQHKV
jgi:hypothetical protein